METSTSTILAPAYLLMNFLFIPRIIYFCGFFAYDGLKNGATLTHFGIRTGLIARLYGVFYLLLCVVELATLPSRTQELLAVDPDEMMQSLTFAAAIPEIGLIFFGISLFIFLLGEGAIWWVKKENRISKRSLPHRIKAARKFMNWMILLPFSIGVQSLLGLPEWVSVGIFVFFMYFAPLTSPRELKKQILMANNEKDRGKKSDPNKSFPDRPVAG